MQAKEHYEKHLASFYSWMIGNIETKSSDFKRLMELNQIAPAKTKTAFDLGAGNGVQSIALKELGFDVYAMDFNEQLLNELEANPSAVGVKTEVADIVNIAEYRHLKPELIACCGDTLTHLESKEQIEKLILDANNILENNGYLILTFRDYTTELDDSQRFIPVKSSDDRILTCILEYGPDKVKVSDLLQEKINGNWNHRVSTYEKVRIDPKCVVKMIKENGLNIQLNEVIDRMHTIIARKPQCYE